MRCIAYELPNQIFARSVVSLRVLYITTFMNVLIVIYRQHDKSSKIKPYVAQFCKMMMVHFEVAVCDLVRVVLLAQLNQFVDWRSA